VPDLAADDGTLRRDLEYFARAIGERNVETIRASFAQQSRPEVYEVEESLARRDAHPKLFSDLSQPPGARDVVILRQRGARATVRPQMSSDGEIVYPLGALNTFVWEEGRWRRACDQHQRGGRVPEIVESDPPRPAFAGVFVYARLRFRAYIGVPTDDGNTRPWSTHASPSFRRRVFRAARCSLSTRSVAADSAIGSPRAMRLGRGHDDAAAREVASRPDDPQLQLVEVYIGPSQSEQLALPSASGHRDVEEGRKLGTPGGTQEAPHALPVEDAHPRTRRPRRSDTVGRIPGNQLPANRVSERLG